MPKAGTHATLPIKSGELPKTTPYRFMVFSPHLCWEALTANQALARPEQSWTADAWLLRGYVPVSQEVLEKSISNAQTRLSQQGRFIARNAFKKDPRVL